MSAHPRVVARMNLQSFDSEDDDSHLRLLLTCGQNDVDADRLLIPVSVRIRYRG
jgi:hypothetical protein